VAVWSPVCRLPGFATLREICVVSDIDVGRWFYAELSFSFVRELENKKTNKIPDTITFECELSLDDAAVEWYKVRTRRCSIVVSVLS